MEYNSPTNFKRKINLKVENTDDSLILSNIQDNKELEKNSENEFKVQLNDLIVDDEKNLDEMLKKEIENQGANEGFISGLFTKFSNLLSCKREQQESTGSLTSYTENSEGSQTYAESRTRSQINPSSYTDSYTEYSRSDVTSQLTSLQELPGSKRTISELEIIAEEQQTDKHQSMNFDTIERT